VTALLARANIDAITLFTEDLAGTKAFYQEVFGLPVVFEDENSAVFRFENSVINLLAGDMVGLEGSVNVRGSRGVRITAGPPPLPSAQSDSTNGVEVLVGEIGTLTLQRGLLPTDQSMEMTPTGVTIDGGVGKVTIKSMTQIELSVCEGVAKITIDPSGVTIDALTINLSAQVMAQLQSIMTQVSGSAMTQISGGITMIG